MKRYRFVYLICIINMVIPTNSWAYNRGTHQHITELAYGLIKYAEFCQVSKNEEDAHRACLSTCSNGDAEKQSACLKACDVEYYQPIDINHVRKKPTSRSICHSYIKLFDAYSSSNKRLEPLYNSELSANEKRSSLFYQSFNTYPCPDESKFSYGISSACNNFKPDGSKKDLEDILIEKKKQQLIALTRAPHAPGVVFTTKDEDWASTEAKGAVANQPRLYYGHLPIIAANLNLTNGTKVKGRYTVDLTGTVLGYYTGIVDKFHDVYTSVKILPLIEDAVKTFGQGTILVVGTAIIVVWAVGAIIVCAATCAINFFFGGDSCGSCFEGSWDDIKDYGSNMTDTVENIEEQNWFGAYNSPTTSSFADNSTFMHFMNTTTVDWQSVANIPSITGLPDISGVIGIFFDYDDVDGYRPGGAFGPGGGVATAIMEGAYIDQLLDVRVSFEESKPALLNYQIMEPDDGMERSAKMFGGLGDHPLRNVFYWHRQGFTDYTFPPIDNLAYYWWHKWWEIRVKDTPGSKTNIEEFGLVPLGAVMHAVQDITQPLHARGVSVRGHKAYEDDVQNRFDHTMYKHMTSGDAPPPNSLILDLEDPEVELEFIQNVIAKFVELHDKFVKPNDVLHIRQLMHHLYEESMLQDTPLKLTTIPAEAWYEFFLAWSFTFEVSEKNTRQINLVNATAATMLILLEASRYDTKAYKDSLNLTTYENFTHKDGKFFEGPDGTYNRLETYRQPLTSTVSYIDDPSQLPSEWACAGALPFAYQGAEDYVNGKINGQKMLEIAMSAQVQCSIMSAGLPMPPIKDIDRLGRYKARRLAADLKMLAHGDPKKRNKEIACAQVEEWEDEKTATPKTGKMMVPNSVYQKVKLQCEGLSDQDNDGVLDEDDQCFTPIPLQQAIGKVVGPDGCYFKHEYTFGQRVDPKFIPGAYYKKGTP